MDREGQIVAARFAGDPEVGAGPSPFRTMRSDPPAPDSELREEMRQLVAQSAIDLRLAVRAEPAI